MEPTLKIKEVDGLELVKKFSEQMESMLRRKVEAVEVQPLGFWGRNLSPASPRAAGTDPPCLPQHCVGAGVV